MSSAPLKDDQLAALADEHNVAQFVSFGPGADPQLRHSRMRASLSGTASAEEAISCLLAQAPSVNIRTFHARKDRGTPFHYKLTRRDDVLELVHSYARQGFYAIVNETLDVNDGGVSGVMLASVLEFAPQDTPRAVERPGVTSVGREFGIELLRLVYGFDIDLPREANQRVEFSVHPIKVGLRRAHTVLWQLDETREMLRPNLYWPNRFSRFIGDKAFGLLVAHCLGGPVPETVVLSRAVAPFTFGTPTSSGERWMRTCPPEPVPGKFDTTYGWVDPFRLLQRQDPDGANLSSVLSQHAVEAKYSGASYVPAPGEDRVEGVHGRGDQFMLGRQSSDELPANIERDVRSLIDGLRRVLGDVRIEWVHDGDKAWIVQLHLANVSTSVAVLSAGEPSSWLEFDPSSGLEALRDLVVEAQRRGAGITVTRPVGMTSHIGEILRSAGVAAHIIAKG